MKKNTFNFFKIMCLIAFLATGHALAQEKSKAILMLNWYNYGEHAPFYLGVEKGYYAAENIVLEIQEGRGSGVTVQAVAAGSATFGYADVGTMIKAVAKGAPVKSVGILLQKTPASIMGFADKNVVKPSDIIGKIVAITPGDALSQIWPVFLKVNGINENQFKTVAGDATTKRNAVINGQADLLIGNINDQKPIIEDVTNKPIRGLLFADYGVNLVNAGVIIHKDMAKTDPDLIRRFLKASIRSVEETKANPDAAVAALLKANPKAGSLKSLSEGLKQTLPLYHTKETEKEIPFKANLKDVDNTIDMMVQYGGVDPTKRGTLSDYYTPEFLPAKK